jgi:hypothetical protein
MKFIKFLFFTLILFNIPSYANENLINERIKFFKTVINLFLILKN